MDDKKLAIIMAILVIIVAMVCSYFIFFAGPHYKTITMNGITMEVPENNATVKQETDIFSIYNDTDNKIFIYVLDSTNFGLGDLAEAMAFAAIRDLNQAGAQQQNIENYNVNYSQKLNTYSYVTNYTHKNLLIVTQDKESMLHILKSINVTQNDTTNQTNTTNTTTPKKTAKKTNNTDPLQDIPLNPDGTKTYKGKTYEEQLDGSWTPVSTDTKSKKQQSSSKSSGSSSSSNSYSDYDDGYYEDRYYSSDHSSYDSYGYYQ